MAGLGQAGRGGAGQVVPTPQAHGWAPIGQPSCAAGAPARRNASDRFCSGLSRERQRPEVRSAGFADRQQEDREAGDRALPRPGQRGCRVRQAAHLLGRLAGRLPGDHAGHTHRPDGERVERVPVHGHVQHVAVGLVLRIGDRPRPGLPRFQPGSARLRADGAGARPRAHTRPGGHAASDRRRVSPISAADQEGEQRHRRQFQRRSALADHRRRRPT